MTQLTRTDAEQLVTAAIQAHQSVDNPRQLGAALTEVEKIKGLKALKLAFQIMNGKKPATESSSVTPQEIQSIQSKLLLASKIAVSAKSTLMIPHPFMRHAIKQVAENAPKVSLEKQLEQFERTLSRLQTISDHAEGESQKATSQATELQKSHGAEGDQKAIQSLTLKLNLAKEHQGLLQELQEVFQEHGFVKEFEAKLGDVLARASAHREAGLTVAQKLEQTKELYAEYKQATTIQEQIANTKDTVKLTEYLEGLKKSDLTPEDMKKAILETEDVTKTLSDMQIKTELFNFNVRKRTGLMTQIATSIQEELRAKEQEVSACEGALSQISVSTSKKNHLAHLTAVQANGTSQENELINLRTEKAQVEKQIVALADANPSLLGKFKEHGRVRETLIKAYAQELGKLSKPDSDFVANSASLIPLVAQLEGRCLQEVTNGQTSDQLTLLNDLGQLDAGHNKELLVQFYQSHIKHLKEQVEFYVEHLRQQKMEEQNVELGVSYGVPTHIGIIENGSQRAYVEAQLIPLYEEHIKGIENGDVQPLETEDEFYMVGNDDEQQARRDELTQRVAYLQQ